MCDEITRYDRDVPVDWNAELQEAIGERIGPHQYWCSEPPLDELLVNPYRHMLFPELVVCPGGTVQNPRLVGDTPETQYIEANCPGGCGKIARWNAKTQLFHPPS